MSSDQGRGERRTSPGFTRDGRTEETNALPVDAVFDVLADERRRHLLYYLIDEAGGTAKASELADYLRSVGIGPARTDRETVLTDLHHRHLPKMEDAGLLEYEGGGGTVRFHGDPLVEECLALVSTRDLGREP